MAVETIKLILVKHSNYYFQNVNLIFMKTVTLPTKTEVGQVTEVLSSVVLKHFISVKVSFQKTASWLVYFECACWGSGFSFPGLYL